MVYRLYIGSNNTTKQVELDKIESIMSSRHEGFTIMPVTGYWNGEKENSVMVIVDDDDTKIQESIAILKSELQQDAIGYQQDVSMQFA